MLRALTAGFLVWTLFPSVHAHAQSHSADLAKAYVAAMSAQQLKASAAQVEGEDGRFVAALLFPGIQLLVVSARVDNPAAVRQLIDALQYQEAYALVNQTAVQDSKFFVQDLKADGLGASSGASVDIVYDHVDKQTIFDGQPAKRNLTAKAYKDAFEAADARYSEALSALLRGVASVAGTAQ